MATRAMTASELAEYYTLYAAVGLSRMNQGQDIAAAFLFDETSVSALCAVACKRSAVRLLVAATLNVDTATFEPDAATILALNP